MAKENVTRRWLPHWYMPGAAHFVTYRLADTLPAHVRSKLNSRRDQLLKQKPPEGTSIAEFRLKVHEQLFVHYDDYLDAQHRSNHSPAGSVPNWLADPRVAAIVRSNLYHHHGSKYHLLAYCIMPNHVHVLLLPMTVGPAASGQENANQSPLAAGTTNSGTLAACTTEQHVGERDDSLSPLAKIMHSLKSYTANEANKILGRNGRFWQKESYDHWVRDDEELERIVNYIRANPVKANLCKCPQDWFWCSCHDRFMDDGDTSGWLAGRASPVL